MLHLRDLSLVPLQICQGLLGDPQVALNLPLGLLNVSAVLRKRIEGLFDKRILMRTLVSA